MLLTCGANAAATGISLDIRAVGRSVVVEAVAFLDADRATAWRVLTDYGRYDEFVPGVQASRVLARSGHSVEVEQTGDASLGPLRERFDVLYEIEEQPEAVVRSRIVAGCDCTLRSTYTLTPSGSMVRLAYSGQLAMGGSIGGAIEESVAKRWIARHFKALVAEIERQGAAASSEPPR